METNFFSFQEVITGSNAYELYLEARYQVFCEELGRVVPTGMKSSRGRDIETDQYDPVSRHFLAFHKPSGAVAGFVRVIMPSPLGLNVSPRYIIEKPLPYHDVTDAVLGEISRMAIVPVFRRRHSDRGRPFQGDPELEMSLQPEGLRQHQPELVLGMYREIYRMCRAAGIDYCVAAMDHRFSRLLISLGFPFVPVGPVNELVDPPRRVYLVSANEIERRFSVCGKEILAFMQTEGAFHGKAEAA